MSNCNYNYNYNCNCWKEKTMHKIVQTFAFAVNTQLLMSLKCCSQLKYEIKYTQFAADCSVK